jgi:hypothetical protein
MNRFYSKEELAFLWLTCLYTFTITFLVSGLFKFSILEYLFLIVGSLLCIFSLARGTLRTTRLTKGTKQEKEVLGIRISNDI